MNKVAEECASLPVQADFIYSATYWLLSHSTLVQRLSGSLIPLLHFAPQEMSCPAQLSYSICSDESKSTSCSDKGNGGSVKCNDRRIKRLYGLGRNSFGRRGNGMEPIMPR